MKNEKLKELIKNSDFVDFYSYKEDKWLQYADIEQKLITVFGSVDKAIEEFGRDEIFNSKNLG